MSDDSAHGLHKEIGGRIRRHRERLGWTQEQLAEVLEMAPASVSRIETGTKASSVRTTARFADALGVPLGDLVDGVHGSPATEVTARERKALRAWRELTQGQQELALAVMREMAT